MYGFCPDRRGFVVRKTSPSMARDTPRTARANTSSHNLIFRIKCLQARSRSARRPITDIHKRGREVRFVPVSDLKVSPQGKGSSLILATSFPAPSQTALGRHRKLPSCGKREPHRDLHRLLVGWHPVFSRRRCPNEQRLYGAAAKRARKMETQELLLRGFCLSILVRRDQPCDAISLADCAP